MKLQNVMEKIKKKLENLAVGSFGHVSHEAAQVAQGSSKLSPKGDQTAQNWTPQRTSRTLKI